MSVYLSKVGSALENSSNFVRTGIINLTKKAKKVVKEHPEIARIMVIGGVSVFKYYYSRGAAPSDLAQSPQTNSREIDEVADFSLLSNNALKIAMVCTVLGSLCIIRGKDSEIKDPIINLTSKNSLLKKQIVNLTSENSQLRDQNVNLQKEKVDFLRKITELKKNMEESEYKIRMLRAKLESFSSIYLGSKELEALEDKIKTLSRNLSAIKRERVEWREEGKALMQKNKDLDLEARESMRKFKDLKQEHKDLEISNEKLERFVIEMKAVIANLEWDVEYQEIQLEKKQKKILTDERRQDDRLEEVQSQMGLLQEVVRISSEIAGILRSKIPMHSRSTSVEVLGELLRDLSRTESIESAISLGEVEESVVADEELYKNLAESIKKDRPNLCPDSAGDCEVILAYINIDFENLTIEDGDELDFARLAELIRAKEAEYSGFSDVATILSYVNLVEAQIESEAIKETAKLIKDAYPNYDNVLDTDLEIIIKFFKDERYQGIDDSVSYHRIAEICRGIIQTTEITDSEAVNFIIKHDIKFKTQEDFDKLAFIIKWLKPELEIEDNEQGIISFILSDEKFQEENNINNYIQLANLIRRKSVTSTFTHDTDLDVISFAINEIKNKHFSEIAEGLD